MSSIFAEWRTWQFKKTKKKKKIIFCRSNKNENWSESYLLMTNTSLWNVKTWQVNTSMHWLHFAHKFKFHNQLNLYNPPHTLYSNKFIHNSFCVCIVVICERTQRTNQIEIVSMWESLDQFITYLLLCFFIRIILSAILSIRCYFMALVFD